MVALLQWALRATSLIMHHRLRVVAFCPQAKYLQGRTQRMQKILQEASAVADQMSAVAQSLEQLTGTTAPPAVENPEMWGYGANGAVPTLGRFVKALDERLINTLQETVMNVNGIFLQVCQCGCRTEVACQVTLSGSPRALDSLVT